MATPSYSPHPLLSEPILYIADPPTTVKWARLKQIFIPCGSVTTNGMNVVQGTPPGAPKRTKYPVRFANIFEAEMALATLQGTLVTDVKPPWKMVLSHSPTLEPSLPSQRIFSQYIRLNGIPYNLTEGVTPQRVFRWFRSAGPLVSVRTNVDVGYAQRAIVLEFWGEAHAKLARKLKNSVHADLKNVPEFTLQTFDPYTLHCTGPNMLVSRQDILAAFSEFGEISNVAWMRVRKSKSYALITFLSHTAAATALHDRNGKTINGSKISVRYHDSGIQTNFFSASASAKKEQEGATGANEDAASSSFEPNKTEQEANNEQEDQKHREAVAEELREAAERNAKEAAAMKAAEAKVQRHREWQLKREAAARAEEAAKQNVVEAEIDDTNANVALSLASQVSAAAEEALANAKAASAEAKRLWLEAMDREAKAQGQVTDSVDDVEHALQRKKRTEICRKIAIQEESVFRAAREAVEKQAGSMEIDEETARLADLAEKVRRMDELRRLEQEEKAERERKKCEAEQAEAERLAREAREAEERARLREEMERLAKEQREREEQARRMADHNRAASIERGRCLKRDLKFCDGRNLSAWDAERALKRFIGVSEEFDTLKFHELTQPLVFESVPWPILDHPHRMAANRVEGTSVDEFFVAIKGLLQTEAEYIALVKKARNRFHPDRWRSRGILNSVLDEGMRSQLEDVGNEVSKQINHLWDRRAR